MAGLSTLARMLGDLLPPRFLFPALAVLILLMLPSWYENMREKQIRGVVRRMVRAEPVERDALYSQALELAGQKRRRLHTLAGEAIRYDQRALRDRALVLLEQTGGREEARTLRQKIEPVRSRYRDPVEAAIRIETLLADGLTEAADEQLRLARAQFPGDAELEALAATRPAPAEAPDGPTETA